MCQVFGQCSIRVITKLYYGKNESQKLLVFTRFMMMYYKIKLLRTKFKLNLI